MIISSGCTGGQDVTSVVKALPEVQQFMKEHPNAQITVTYWSKEEVAQSAQEISQQCDKPITPMAMYKATVSEGDLKIVSWINAENQIVLCSITQGRGDTQIKTPTPTPTSTPAAASTTEVLVVDVTITKPPDDDSSKIISNVNAHISYAMKAELPKETPLSAPGITVMLIQNGQEKSSWYSVPIPSNTTIYGKYSITVKPFDKLDRSQPLRILTRVVDPAGKDVSVRATDIKLE